MKPSVLKPKFDINIRFEREVGVARITFLKKNKRHGQYVYCASESVEAGKCDLINIWLRRNHTLAIQAKRIRAIESVAA